MYLGTKLFFVVAYGAEIARTWPPIHDVPVVCLRPRISFPRSLALLIEYPISGKMTQ